ncbi:hypothetical protein D3C77_109270 [compost metagenome]
MHALDAQPRETTTTGTTRLVMLIVEHDLEQRVVASAAFGLQGFDQQVERQVLIALGLNGGLAHLRQYIGETRTTIEASAQDLGINEKTNQPLRLHTVAIGKGHTDADLLLPAVTVQQGLERGHHQHEQAHPLTLRQLPERVQQFKRQLHLAAIAPAVAA